MLSRVDVSGCFGVSMLSRVDVSECFGVSIFWSADGLECRWFVVSMSMFCCVDVLLFDIVVVLCRCAIGSSRNSIFGRSPNHVSTVESLNSGV